MIPMETIAGIELGGTKALAVLARGSEILASARFATTTPNETLGALVDTLEGWKRREGFAALGIASFGPLRLDPGAADFGTMLATPKAGWSGANIAGALSAVADCPWRIDTDVNAAALAEWRWGAGQGLDSLCYLTLGTGVGGGLLLGGHPVHGALHPEIGHLRLRRASGDDFSGSCPFHGDCIEGLLSGPALEARFGRAGEEIPAGDPRWLFVAHDLAQLIGALLLVTSPQKILIGGGIGMARSFLLERAWQHVVADLAGYLPFVPGDAAEDLVTLPALGDRAGPLGAVALGEAALIDARTKEGKF